MIKRILRTLTVSATLVSIVAVNASAQDDLQTLLRAGTSDANELMGAYINPFMKGFGTALGNGWYNTAKPHKSLGFDLTITVNSARVPDEDLFFNPDNLNLQNTTLISSGTGDRTVPTIFGDEVPSRYEFTDNNGNSVDFDGPEGLALKENTGMQAVPVPMAQLGIGIYKNTDLKIRWTPEIEFDGNGSFKLVGFAAMHDIKQWIPGIKLAPFDLSVLIGFTDISLSYDLAEESASGGGGEVTTDNGIAAFDVNTWTFQGIISKKFSVLTLYGGLGFNKVTSDLALKGDYELRDDFGVVEEVVTDPIGIGVNESGARISAGMRLKLAIVTLHADYTIQKYNTLTVGFGFSVR
ncbi:hypothetical protein E1176_14695 [Fulvivirga sp. RKSG066]|uniref:DUF6588 family protein n=1 Tax=Fulvivirga aurantia TaxID=2529383 RepID=UPI0012BCF70D|nr:DUF6588 family protein [Fulvivirga aurantia]MTI22277.1 hypothetical protein [Fulvivirga aurantia]